MVNESHPPGSSFPADSSPGFSYAAPGAGQYEQAGHGSYTQQDYGQPAASDGYSTGTFDSHGFSYDADPLYDPMPGTGADAGVDSGAWTSGTYDASYGHGSYDSGAYDDNGAYNTGTYDTGSYDTGAYDTSAAWAQAGFPQTADIPGVHLQSSPDQADFGWNSGQWHASQWNTSQWDTAQWDTSEQWDSPAPDANGSRDAYESYDAHEAHDYGCETQHGYGSHDADTYVYAYAADAPAQFDEPGAHFADGHDDPGEPVAPATPVRCPEADLTVPNLPGRRRSRRPRRSALLTVAVPSVAVMGVAAAAAASVAGNAPQDDTTTQASADVPLKPVNRKLDTQLAGLSADADDFADRASRTQERLDLQARQEAERKRKAREAARKEALRPKFALPVKEHGLSATYGQAGLNWMSVHTGIDFPVSEGTPVMAATDGTVTTKYDMAFGNMAVVTSPDGTETWYCHLSSTKIRSGQVKAGDTIAYSGASGNSTGPHLHFEVHPGGGDAIDPLPWLRSKGLDPQ